VKGLSFFRVQSDLQPVDNVDGRYPSFEHNAKPSLTSFRRPIWRGTLALPGGIDVFRAFNLTPKRSFNKLL